ncbi:MAG TPA: hypothetical protein EYN91_12280 [Candidatus Melainabacteria bacterium]|nr:hypothetical protein [Candidatus Melainabacteria bacterium]HIN63313.1 hypothetical protein [Candidatus Obscuribacterales bacterium]
MQIHQAASRGDKEAILRQLRAGVPVDEHNDDSTGATPLIWAAGSRKADVSVLALLIEHGADVNAVSKTWTSTPLTASKYQPDKFHFLLANGAQPIRPEHASYLLYPSVSTDFVRGLLEQGVDPREDPREINSALMEASRTCEWERIQLFFEYGITIEDLGWSPVMYAVVFGTVEDLSRALAQPEGLFECESWDRTAFLLSICVRSIEKAKMLLNAGSSIDEQGRCGMTCLHYAAQEGQTEMINWLLSLGVDVDILDSYEETPLMTAVKHEQADAAQLFLNAGANALAEEDVGLQPINMATCPEIVEILVRAGADIDRVDPRGEVVLKEAAEKGNGKLVERLIALGANVNNLGGGVGTALNAATNCDELEIMKVLLDAGADPNLPVEDGWRSLWYLRSREAAEILVNGGARLDLQDDFGGTAIHHQSDDEIRIFQLQTILLTARSSA